MRAAGRKPVLLGLTVDQLDKIRQAAALELRPVSQFITFYAMQAAEVALDRIQLELSGHKPQPK